MKISVNGIVYGVIAFLLAALIGVSTYLFLIHHAVVDSYARAEMNYKSAVYLSRIGVLPRYGTITSLNASNDTITVSVPRRYTSGASAPIVLELRVNDNTLIFEQHLEGAGGVYTALSTPVPATYADLKAGDRIMTVFKSTGSATEAQLIVFGNPI